MSSRPSIELLAEANQRLEETIASEQPLQALDTMTEPLDYAMSVVRHLESVATTPAAARRAITPFSPKPARFIPVFL